MSGRTSAGELVESARGLAQSRMLRGFLTPLTFDFLTSELSTEHSALAPPLLSAFFPVPLPPQQPAVEGGHDGLGAVLDVELAEDAGDVGLDGLGGDGHFGGDEFVRPAFGHVLEDDLLAGGEGDVAAALVELAKDGLGEVAAARSEGADGVDEIGPGGGLGQVTTDAGGDGAVDVFLGLFDGEEEEAGGIVALDDFAGGIGAVHVGEVAVEDDDIGPVLGVEVDGVLAAGAFGDDADAFLEIEGGGEADAGEEVVVHDHDADGVFSGWLHGTRG